MKNIKFILSQASLDFVDKRFYPVPASKEVPEWYKIMESSHENKQNTYDTYLTQTIKRCMPVFDSIAAGYIIKTFCDFTILDEVGHKGSKQFKWPTEGISNLISLHPAHQVNGYKGLELPMGAYKWTNPWGIQTPKGYSLLVINPLHRPNIGLNILEGVVDSDTYFSPINLPFIVNENFTGTIPAGTPIAQIIPFKRDEFKMIFGDDNDRKEAIKIYTLIRSLYLNGYRNHFRQKKSYT